MVGGKVCGWDFNGAAGSGDVFVCEVDESDGTHALVHPAIGVVPNVEDDHAWSVGGVDALMGNFKRFGLQSRRLLYIGSQSADKLYESHPDSLRMDASLCSAQGYLKGLSSSVASSWGAYQRLNGAQAVQAAVELGLERQAAEKALESYPGVDRRMSLRYEGRGVKLLEDYAHHPTELHASLSAIIETNPDRRLVAVFQPHRYARLEKYIDRFAEELGKAGQVFVTPVFAAWCSRGKVDSKELAARIGSKAKALEGSWDSMAREILLSLKAGDVLAIIGAGDLKAIIPLLIKELEQGVSK